MSGAGITIRNFLRANPYIDDCFRAGLINNAALARQIVKSSKNSSHSAIVMGLSRHAARIKKKPSYADGRFLQLLRSARILVRTGMLVLSLRISKNDKRITALLQEIFEKGKDGHLIEGIEYTTIITNQEFSEIITKKFKNNICSIHLNAAQVSVILDPSTQLMPGITAFLINLIAKQKINIYELASSFGEDMFVIDRKDLESALNALKV